VLLATTAISKEIIKPEKIASLMITTHLKAAVQPTSKINLLGLRM
jgi:ABC-type uncharacterized transport system ATPase component